MSDADLLLKYVRDGLDASRPWDQYNAYSYASNLIMECRVGLQPDWHNIVRALAAMGNTRINAMLAGLDGCDMAARVGRRAYLAGYAQHLRAFRRRQLDAALRYVIANEPEELDAPLGLGYTGMDGAEMREWRGQS